MNDGIIVSLLEMFQMFPDQEAARVYSKHSAGAGVQPARTAASS